MNELIENNSDAEMAMIETTTKRLMLSDKFAETMCRASLLPEHLRTVKKNGKVVALAPDEVRANCILIVNQALRWGVDPFAILPSTFVIGGKLGFDGKLIAAIVNKLGGLADRLSYEFSGEGDGLTVTVSGRLEGENDPRTLTVSVKEAKTDNQIWKKDPQQKLVYTGATRWARRHCPHVILGIISDDEPVYDTVDAIASRAVAHPQQPPVETGSDAALIESYRSKISRATSRSEITSLVDLIRGEAIDKLALDDQEDLVALSRERYTELEPEASGVDYELQMIESQGNRESLAKVGEAIAEDKTLSPSQSKKWGQVLQSYVDDLAESPA